MAGLELEGSLNYYSMPRGLGVVWQGLQTLDSSGAFKFRGGAQSTCMELKLHHSC